MTNMTAKVSTNYTEEMIASMLDQYEGSPVRATVDQIASQFNKTPRSIIAKLSALGVYQKPVAVTKRGEPIVKKEVYIAKIQAALNTELTSFEKMTKADLEVLAELVSA